MARRITKEFFCRSYFHLLVILLLVLIFYPSIQITIGSFSPIISRQEVLDESQDWVDMVLGDVSKNKNKNGPGHTDIKSVNYLSDGKFLNTTFWLSSLYGLESLKDSSTRNQVYYGILFDSDVDASTGYHGTDYMTEIKWNDTSKKWNQSFHQFSADGHTRNVTAMIEISDNLFDRKSSSLSILTDLKYMQFPSHYKAFFYAYSFYDGNYLLDSTGWTLIPSQEYEISTVPKIIALTKGEKVNVDIIVNSSASFQTSANLSIDDLPQGVTIDIDNPLMIIPSMGFASTTMSINSNSSSNVGSNTFLILANISFPTSTFWSPIVNPVTGKNPVLSIPVSENLYKPTSIMLLITNPMPIEKQIKQWLEDWFNPLTGTWTTITTIATGVLGWKIWQRKKNGKKRDDE